MTDTALARPRAISALPTPGRWKPARAGLIALWRYWDETFTFHNGRLLLRGPNGSGKSMALELLLPFLLDADASPTRLTSAARSRGGLFERIMTGSSDSARTGFAWVEFRNGHEVFTIGARLRTSTASRNVDASYFTTTQQIGIDLHLLDPGRVPLSRRDLEAAIAEHGRVHHSGEEHRAAVRSTLFPGFAADRYASVVTALLALRKEKLSQNLDLDKLSEVLSEALAPIDEHDLTAVAEGFERLDRRRAELIRLESEVGEARQLALRQRSYARAVLREVAGEVRSAESRRDDVTRTEREARATLQLALDEVERLDAEFTDIEQRLAALQVERDALRDRDAYREGTNLDDLRTEARRLDEAVTRSAKTADLSAQALQSERDVAVDASTRAGEITSNRDQALSDVRQSAAQVGAEAVIDDAGLASGSEVDDAYRLLEAWIGARRAVITEVRAALRAHAAAIQQRDYNQQRVEQDRDTLEQRSAAESTAQQGLSEASRAYVTDVEVWVGSCRAIASDRVRAAMPIPAEVPEQVRAALAELAGELRAEHEVSVAAADRRRDALTDDRATLDAERQRYAAGQVVVQPPPPWRDERTDRAGAPLWQLVELGDDIPRAAINGLEAALTAAGLLDAWVTPAGAVDLAEQRSDVTLTVRPLSGPTLADYLRPLADAPVPEPVTAAVLASVAVTEAVTAQARPGSTDVVVAVDGSFRLGPAVGRGAVRPAVLLGATARERRRRERLAELDAALDEIDTRLTQVQREVEGLGRHRVAVVAELAAVPSGEAVVEGQRAVASAAARRAESEDRVAAARRALGQAEQVAREALRALTTAAALHGLPTESAGLDEVAAALTGLERRATTWVRRAHEAERAVVDHRRAEQRVELARVQTDTAATHLAADRRAHAEVAGRVHTLESTVGAEYREIVDRLDRLDRDRSTAQARQHELNRERPQAGERVGRLKAQLDRAEAARVSADEDRGTAHRRFVAATHQGLDVDAGVRLSGGLDGVTAVLNASRELAAELGAASSESQGVEKTSAALAERLHQTEAALGGRIDLDRRLTEENWWTLSAMVSGLRRSITELVSTLERELSDGQQEFLAEEEQLFEQVLAGSIRRSLASRIRLANQLVDNINAQLNRVRTAAGAVSVRLRWDVDPNQLDAVKSARALLLRDPQDLTESESTALQEFVRARVEQARAELESSAPWDARLRETLDYRAWHRFSLQIAHRDWDGYQLATAGRLQRLSTGERSIALHLPMMASIAAHYADERGEPSPCPRLILLDELFAGVDPANRAQLFGTFTAWDLDAVFTSDHEWCQYATLDGIAIHHLHPPIGDDPVTSTRFTWDGKRRTIDPATG